MPWHVVASREPSSHLIFDALGVHFQISQREDCAPLSNKNTFSRVEAQGAFVGQVHEYTDPALRGVCAQAWFVVPPPASARTFKRKSVVTNIFLVACGAQGIVCLRVAGNHGKVPVPMTLPNASNDPFAERCGGSPIDDPSFSCREF